MSPPLAESQANIGQAGLRLWDLLLPGALGHDRLLERAFSFSLLSTVTSTTTKGAPNNKGSHSEAPKPQHLWNKVGLRGSHVWLMVADTGGCEDGTVVDILKRPVESPVSQKNGFKTPSCIILPQLDPHVSSTTCWPWHQSTQSHPQLLSV